MGLERIIKEFPDYDDHSQAYFPHMNKESGIHVSLNLSCIKIIYEILSTIKSSGNCNFLTFYSLTLLNQSCYNIILDLIY